MTHALAFLASFGYVFLKSLQQLNVVHKKYAWIIPTSWAMAALEVYVVASIAKNGFGWLVFWVGLGSGLGSITAVWIHDRAIHDKPRIEPAVGRPVGLDADC